MIDQDHNQDGEHGVGLVAYMYDEVEAASRNKFESHLAACDECAMELASFADARLGVIEWRREDFDPLATPVILLPESERIANVADIPARAGVFASLRELLVSWPVFAQAGAGLAAAALLVGFVYLAKFSGPNDENFVAHRTSESVVETAEQKDSKPTTVTTVNSEKAAPKRKEVAQASLQKPVIQHSAPRIQLAPSRTNDRSPVVIKSSPPRVQATTKVPRLNNLDDDEDKSLRLADLFAEIGTSEE